MSPYQETSPTEEIEIEPKCAEQVETCPTHEYKCAHLLPLTASYFLLTRSLAKHSLDPQKSTKSRANRPHLLREESSLDFLCENNTALRSLAESRLAESTRRADFASFYLWPEVFCVEYQQQRGGRY